MPCFILFSRLIIYLSLKIKVISSANKIDYIYIYIYIYCSRIYIINNPYYFYIILISIIIDYNHSGLMANCNGYQFSSIEFV